VADQKQAKLVAIVDDDSSVRTALLGLMKAAGFPAQAFASAEEFLQSGEESRIGCLVADIRMPGMSGLELQARLKARSAGIAVIFITAHGDPDTRRRALSSGAVRFFQKPFDDEELLNCIRAATGT
jgi:FixJ family two-component response regulator